LLGAHFDWCTIGEGVRSFEQGGGGRSLVALSFDDGYRDNHSVLLPILAQTGARATVFLEGAPLGQGTVSWSHKFFWLLHVTRIAPEQLVQDLQSIAPKAKGFDRLAKAAQGAPAGREYQIKRVLKYHCDASERNRLIHRIFLGHGGVEQELREALYLSREQVLEMHRAGVELGGHTEGHEVLATLSPEEALQQIRAGRETMVELLGSDVSPCFAYPFGRRWDFNAHSQQAVAQAGYSIAVTTHGGAYQGRGDKLTLGRTMLSEDLPYYQVMMEACGAYQWLRKLGIDLAP
jgi:peptidoglycan/xylan/chitin deacetylase (PgdA/CDA1 family)